MGLTYLALGDASKAIEVFEQDLDKQGRHPQQIANLAVAYFKSGNDAKASVYRSELETLAEQQFLSPALLATIEFAAGDADRGFELLQEAVDVRVREVIFLRVNRMLTGYREDPRYEDLLAAVGL